MNRDTLEALRKRYPTGTVVELIEMPDDPHPVPPGTKGTVQFIDDEGTVFVRWENGSGLGLVYGVDRFRKAG